jgi:hypothetical protein
MRSTARIAALVALLVLAGCGLADPTLPPPPSEADAITFVDLLVEKAEAGDLAGFCDVAGGGNCVEIAEESGGVAAIPNDPPVIAGTRLIPSRPAGEGTLAGGQLLVLCGIDGRGQPYRTETLVSIGPDHVLYAINAVYWSGFHLAVAGDTGSPSGGAGIECPDAFDPTTGSPARFRVHPDHPLQREDESLILLVTEIACSGNRPIDDKLLPPVIEYGANHVLVRLFLEPLEPVDHPCIRNDATRMIIDLGEPIGDRILVDGSVPPGP